MIKKIFINSYSLFSKYRLFANHDKIIDKQINYLKSTGKLKRFPTDKVKPSIANYPYYKEKYIKYFDFFYSVNGMADSGYIPLSYYYYYIEPHLNDRLLSAGLKDKNFYELFFKDVDTPKVLLRKIKGLYYNNCYEFIELNKNNIKAIFDPYEKFILKPSIESGAGKSILLFQKSGEDFVSGNEKYDTNFLKNYKQDFLIQEFVNQHPFFKKFNPTSNNTLRIFTYRSVKDDSINILHILLRIGMKGSFLDHDNFGGVAVSINKDNLFNKYAYNSFGEKFSQINNINFSEAGKVPFIKEAAETAINIAKKIFYARLLAMDLTINEEGKPLLIEINCWNNGISQYQMNNGSLFKEFTDEILEYSRRSGIKTKKII